MAHPILGVHRKYFLVLIPYNLRVWSERLPWRTCNNQGYHMTRVTACCWPKCHWRVRLESKLFMLVCRGELTARTVQQFQYNNHHVAHCTYLGKSVTSTTSKSVIKRSLFGLGSRLPTYCDHSCGNTNDTQIILLLAVFLAVVTALTYWMGSVCTACTWSQRPHLLLQITFLYSTSPSLSTFRWPIFLCAAGTSFSCIFLGLEGDWPGCTFGICTMKRLSAF